MCGGEYLKTYTQWRAEERGVLGVRIKLKSDELFILQNTKTTCNIMPVQRMPLCTNAGGVDDANSLMLSFSPQPGKWWNTG